MNRLAVVRVARTVEERVVVAVVVVMMVVIPVMVVVPRISPRPVPRVIPSCPIRPAIPPGIIHPRVIEPSAVEPRVVPSGVVGRTVDSPAVSVRSPRIAVAEAHERVDIDCRDVRILKVERERLRCLRESRLCCRRAVTRIEHRRLCQLRERVRLFLALREFCGICLFRPRIVDSVILTDSLCRRSTGRRHDAAYRQRNDSRHS